MVRREEKLLMAWELEPKSKDWMTLDTRLSQLVDAECDKNGIEYEGAAIC